MLKDIFAWTVDTARGTLWIPDKRLSTFSARFDIPSLQRRLSVYNLRRLIRELRSIHMTVPVAIGHFYHLQLSLTCVGTGYCTYLSKGLYQDILHWRQLFRDVLNQPTFLAELVQRLLADFGFYDA